MDFAAAENDSFQFPPSGKVRRTSFRIANRPCRPALRRSKGAPGVIRWLTLFQGPDGVTKKTGRGMGQEAEIAERAERLLTGPLSALGFQLLEVQYRFEGRWILRLIVDGEQGITLEDSPTGTTWRRL